MARLIQSDIKTPLADELLFGRLKDGGHVKVIIADKQNDDADKSPAQKGIDFVYESGPIKPRPERETIQKKTTPKKRASSASASKKSKVKAAGKNAQKGEAAVSEKTLPPVQIVPKLPLTKPKTD